MMNDERKTIVATSFIHHSSLIAHHCSKEERC